MAFDPTKTEQKDDFKQEDIPSIPVSETIVDAPDGKVLQSGSFSSPNFRTGKSGWTLKGDGSCEFGSGIFRGRITASSITTNQQEITVELNESIADAITELGASGGTIRLKAGTYVLTDDINIPSNVVLRGQGMGVTILYFATLNKGIKAQGSSNYSAGTVSINNGSTSLSGVGTSWLANITTGHKIRLNNYWYEIASVDSDNGITLSSKYIGSNIAGATYDSAIMVEHFFLEHLTVAYSGGNGIYINYGYYFFLDNVASVNNNGDGVSINNSTSFVCRYVNCFDNGSDGMYLNQIDHLEGDVLWCLRNTSKGINGTKIYDSKINSVLCRNNEGGAYLDTFVDSAINVSDISNNTNIGLELNASNILFLTSSEFQNNGSDGVKLTANCDNLILNGNTFNDNGGYGLNIAASTDDNNIINNNIFDNNSSGELNDSGTNTMYGLNQGLTTSYGIAKVATVSNNLKQSADTERSKTFDTNYTMVKQITFIGIGKLRVKFDMKGNGFDAYGRIYKNGVAYGIERQSASQTYITYSEDLTFEPNDTIEIYYKTAGDASATTYIKNFRIYYDESSYSLTVNTD